MTHFYIRLYLVALCLFIQLPAHSQTKSASDNQEAASFFHHILQQTNNPVIARMAQSNLNTLQYNPIPKQHRVVVQSLINKHLLIPVLLNQNTSASFMVDTGSTYSLITPALANRLGIQITDKTPRVTIVTVNGMVRVPLVTIDSLTVADIKIKNLQAIVQPLGKSVIPVGFLGMNFFKGMEYSIQQNQLILTVSKES